VRVVIEAIPAVPFGGYAVALEGLLRGWDRLDTDDEIHLLMAEGVEFEIPASVHVHRFTVGRPAVLRRVAVQSRAARRVCEEVGADVLLGLIPTTAVTRVGAPKVIIVYDLRDELVPEQFSRGRRLLRRLSYGIGYRQAAGAITISERTKNDLLRSRPWMSSKPVSAVHLAADRVDDWPRDGGSNDQPYALAFGHFPNKAVNRVIDAWEILKARGEEHALVFVGVPDDSRGQLLERIRSAGVDGLVTVLPWLDEDEFNTRFASAGLIVFPSDFEGFGLPAAEAMRLGIPLVISDDEALLEVSGGNATVVAETDATSLANGVSAAWSTPREDLERARSFADRYTSERMASETRAFLARIIDGAKAPSR
jgi:glycosyltransferase involved in cell wall biosynthesis